MDKTIISDCCRGQKCPDSSLISNENNDLRMDLEETFNEMSKRQCELAQKRQYLTQKITSLEQALPLIAYKNLSSIKNKNKSTFFETIKNLLDQLSPYPHPTPTEKLLEKTKLELKKIDEEIEVLHKQVLEIEVKLEESEMELESLESINKELDEKLKIAEKKMLTRNKKSRAFPDLSSIDAEDLVCLGKLRHLVQQEIRLKNCINSLEARENSIRIQMEKFMNLKEERSCPRPRKLKNKKSNKRINKYKNGRVKSQKRFPCEISKNPCHCGSTESLNCDTTLSDDDETTSEEYCDCCDCGLSTTTASSNP